MGLIIVPSSEYTCENWRVSLYEGLSSVWHIVRTQSVWAIIMNISADLSVWKIEKTVSIWVAGSITIWWRSISQGLWLVQQQPSRAASSVSQQSPLGRGQLLDANPWCFSFRSKLCQWKQQGTKRKAMWQIEQWPSEGVWVLIPGTGMCLFNVAKGILQI